MGKSRTGRGRTRPGRPARRGRPPRRGPRNLTENARNKWFDNAIQKARAKGQTTKAESLEAGKSLGLTPRQFRESMGAQQARFDRTARIERAAQGLARPRRSPTRREQMARQTPEQRALDRFVDRFRGRQMNFTRSQARQYARLKSAADAANLRQLRNPAPYRTPRQYQAFERLTSRADQIAARRRAREIAASRPRQRATLAEKRAARDRWREYVLRTRAERNIERQILKYYPNRSLGNNWGTGARPNPDTHLHGGDFGTYQPGTRGGPLYPNTIRRPRRKRPRRRDR